MPAGSCRSTGRRDRKSTRLNSSHLGISDAVFCLEKIAAALFHVWTNGLRHGARVLSGGRPGGGDAARRRLQHPPPRRPTDREQSPLLFIAITGTPSNFSFSPPRPPHV